jgi:Family of unknown function (DUF6489)
MKITLNVDCTPEEARAFFGLPDLRPLQTELLDQLKDRLSKSMQAIDPEALVRTWFANPMKAFEKMQEIFRAGTKPPEK